MPKALSIFGAFIFIATSNIAFAQKPKWVPDWVPGWVLPVPAFTLEEKLAIEKQKDVLDEIMKLYATMALERPKDLRACVQEMFALQRSGQCRDRFSHYTASAQTDIESEDHQGEFGGVGGTLTFKDGRVQIMSVMPKTPAERAGLKAGDIILKINGEEVKDLIGAVKMLRGKAGTSLTLEVWRDKFDKPKTFTLTREVIHIESVTAVILEAKLGDRKDKVGHVKVLNFRTNTVADFAKAIETLAEKKVYKVILDFRNNPGGSLPSVLEMLAFFMKAQDVAVTIKERVNEKVYDATYIARNYNIRGFGNFKGMKVVVLINGGSASASEIFAGTMKDWGYPIVGEKSFGKGVGQAAFQLSDGSKFWLTTFEFLVGNNRVPIRDQGVIPTVPVVQPEGEKQDLQLEKAIELLMQGQP